MNTGFSPESDERLHLQARLEDYNAYTDEIARATHISDVSERVASALSRVRLYPTDYANRATLEYASYAKATNDLAKLLVRERAVLVTPKHKTMPATLPMPRSTEAVPVPRAA